MVAVTINDKIAKVGDSAMELLNTCLKFIHPPSVGGNPEFKSYVDQIVLGLMIKIGDSKKNSKDLADICTIALGDCNDVGPYILTNLFVKTHGVPQVVNDFKHLTSRLETISKLAQSYGVGENNVPMQKAMDFAVKNLENSKATVRNAASDLIVELMKIVGAEAVKPYLEKVRDNIVEKIISDYNASLGVNPDNDLKDDLNHPGKRPIAPSSKQPPPNKKDESKVCEYCQRASKHFLDSKKYEMHLWKECPMLTTCKECALVVEVCNLNEHLLSECKHANNYVEVRKYLKKSALDVKKQPHREYIILT